MKRLSDLDPQTRYIIRDWAHRDADRIIEEVYRLSDRQARISLLHSEIERIHREQAGITRGLNEKVPRTEREDNELLHWIESAQEGSDYLWERLDLKEQLLITEYARELRRAEEDPARDLSTLIVEPMTWTASEADRESFFKSIKAKGVVDADYATWCAHFRRANDPPLPLPDHRMNWTGEYPALRAIHEHMVDCGWIRPGREANGNYSLHPFIDQFLYHGDPINQGRYSSRPDSMSRRRDELKNGDFSSINPTSKKTFLKNLSKK